MYPNYYCILSLIITAIISYHYCICLLSLLHLSCVNFRVSYTLELAGIHQVYLMYCTSYVQKSAILQLCNTANLWIRKYNGFILQLTTCQVIIVGYIIAFWLGPVTIYVVSYHRLLVRPSYHICSIIPFPSG